MPLREARLPFQSREAKASTVMPKSKIVFLPRKQQHQQGTAVYLLDFSPVLDSGETISSVSSADANGVTRGVTAPAGLTAGSPSIVATAATSSEDGRTIAASKSLNVSITCLTAKPGKVYEVKVIVGTSLSQTKVGILEIEIL